MHFTLFLRVRKEDGVRSGMEWGVRVEVIVRERIRNGKRVRDERGLG